MKFGPTLRRLSTALLLQGVVALWFCSAASAQDVARTPPADPSSISFEHDGKGVAGFAVYVTPEGGQPLRLDLGALKPDAAGKIVARIPPLPPGIYTLEIAAYNASGESDRIPADPPRVTITARAGGTPPADHSQHTASSPAPAKADTDKSKTKKPEPEKAKDQEKKKGLFGRVYRGIVGSDDETGSK